MSLYITICIHCFSCGWIPKGTCGSKGMHILRLLIYIIKSQETICFGNQMSTNTSSYSAKHNKPFSEVLEGTLPISPWPVPSFPSAFCLNVTLSERSWCLSHAKWHPSFSFYIPLADAFSSAALSTSNRFCVGWSLCLSRSARVGTSLYFVYPVPPGPSPCPAQNKSSINIVNKWMEVNASSLKLMMMIIFRAS